MPRDPHGGSLHETAPAAWRALAVCRDWPAAWWYPERGDNAVQAKRICATCPVRQACLDHAVLTGERWGIWGGVSIERHRHPQRINVAAKPIDHGTDAGYAAHRRHGEQPCPPCTEAHARRVYAYKQTRRRGAA